MKTHTLFQLLHVTQRSQRLPVPSSPKPEQTRTHNSCHIGLIAIMKGMYVRKVTCKVVVFLGSKTSQIDMVDVNSPSQKHTHRVNIIVTKDNERKQSQNLFPPLEWDSCDFSLYNNEIASQTIQSPWLDYTWVWWRVLTSTGPISVNLCTITLIGELLTVTIISPSSLQNKNTATIGSDVILAFLETCTVPLREEDQLTHSVWEVG